MGSWYWSDNRDEGWGAASEENVKHAFTFIAGGQHNNDASDDDVLGWLGILELTLSQESGLDIYRDGPNRLEGPWTRRNVMFLFCGMCTHAMKWLTKSGPLEIIPR